MKPSIRVIVTGVATKTDHCARDEKLIKGTESVFLGTRCISYACDWIRSYTSHVSFVVHTAETKLGLDLLPCGIVSRDRRVMFACQFLRCSFFEIAEA